MLNPYSVICPKCSAAIGVKCLEPKLDGSRFILEAHSERKALVEKKYEDNYKDHGYPDAATNFFRRYFQSKVGAITK